MKNALTRYGFLAVLLSVLGLPACRNVEQDFSEPSEKTVRFLAGMTATRTAFGEMKDGAYPTYWTARDEGVLLSLNYDKAEISAVTPSEDGETASFSATFDASSAKAPYTFYAVSPASAARAISPSRSAWSVNIAPDQTPLGNSVDEAAQLLVARTAALNVLPDEVELHFSHLTAYGRITLKDLELGSAEVKSVELTCSTPLVGEWYWREDGSIESNGASSTITLHTDASGDLWFACAPVDVSGARFRISVFTSQGVIEKEITFAEGRKFSSGKVARFSVDMSGIEPVGTGEAFVLVENSATLAPGDQVIFLNASRDRAMGPQEKNYRSAETAGFSLEHSRVILQEGSAVRVFTVSAGVSSGTWSFKDKDGYLAATLVSSKNYLRSVSEKDAYSSWTVSVADGGDALVKASAGQKNLLRYNPSAPRFSCYGSGQDAVRIYRKTQAAGPVAADPLTGSDAYGSYVSGAERTYSQGADQISRSYVDGKLVFAILNPSAKEQLVVTGYDPSRVKGDAVTVTLNYRKGRQTIRKGTYNLTVVGEDGPKVWLGDGSGQGFILKK
ncbi:MAG: hypothetical protein II874_07435 [Bacteroidales bacterium]|nr:hypothetical protein [Bacteroidales bacterium]